MTPLEALAQIPDWTKAAACEGVPNGDYDPWHPEGDDGPTLMYAVARRVCQGCPVRLECLLYGLELLKDSPVLGMYGGLTPEELRRLARRKGRPARRIAQHGTRARYVSYNCRCDRCREANARDEHTRRLGELQQAIRAARGVVSQRLLARRYGVSQRTIAKAQLRINWAEVE